MTDYAQQAEQLARLTRPPLELVKGNPQADPTPVDLAYEQTEAAIARGRQDLSHAPRWAWSTLHTLVGQMLPGDFWVVGGLYGNGKTSFLFSQLDAFAKASVPVLYLPLEVEPKTARRRWAAWELGLEWVHVARNEWLRLPPNSQEKHEQMMIRQAANGLVQFPPGRRLTVELVGKWMRWGVREFGAKVVFIDHFHRLNFGRGEQQYRIAVTEAARDIKDLAEAHELVVIAASQLNQHEADPLDRYFPPTLRRLKESSGLAEEPDSVLMLSRRLRGAVSKEDMQLIKMGHKSDRDFAEPRTMAVTCRKHRLDDAVAGDRTVLLSVESGGRVVDREPEYQQRDWTDDAVR